MAGAQNGVTKLEDEAPASFDTIDTIIVDLRPGEDEVRAPSRAAFRDALGEFGELQLTLDSELRHTLSGKPYSATLEQGRETLASATKAYSSMDCPSVQSRTEHAILDFAAADASGVSARAELHQAYLLRILCADRSGDVDSAMSAAAALRTLSSERRPKELSEVTWDKYPALDAQSSQIREPVTLESTPTGAKIYIDFEPHGASPLRVFLSAGEHVIAMATERAAGSQVVRVTGPTTIRLPLHQHAHEWDGITNSIDALRQAQGSKRAVKMRDLMAAAEAQVAFVMRDPGRTAVWILPEGRAVPQLAGHAPSASIAGALALQALREMPASAGLDPRMPLLREGDEQVRKAHKGPRWWVYGSVVLGAAVVGAGLIIAQDFTDDTQRIEVTLP